jgi:hypothetical protein
MRTTLLEIGREKNVDLERDLLSLEVPRKRLIHEFKVDGIIHDNY